MVQFQKEFDFMDTEFLSPNTSINMNENDLFKTIKGQKRVKSLDGSLHNQEVLKRELEAFRESWSPRSKEELLEALLKIKKCELEMRLGCNDVDYKKR